MIGQLDITVLVDDRVNKAGLLAEHGFSCWVNTGSHKFLFDTGGGLVLDHNAYLLDVPLGTADAVVLSHGHDDHTGGLPSVFRHNPDIAISVHPQAFVPRFVQEEDNIRPNGFAGCPSLVKNRERLLLTEQATEIFPCVSVTGTIPRAYDTRHANRRYYLDNAGTSQDPFTDEQAAILETAQGTVVLVGCSHAGLVNIMEYVADLTGKRDIHAIIGGLHLADASPDTMENVLDMLFEFNVKLLGLAHCTGPEAEALLRSKFPSRCSRMAVGTRIRI